MIFRKKKAVSLTSDLKCEVNKFLPAQRTHNVPQESSLDGFVARFSLFKQKRVQY